MYQTKIPGRRVVVRGGQMTSEFIHEEILILILSRKVSWVGGGWWWYVVILVSILGSRPETRECN